jgi:hypothetical protein
MMHHFVCQRRPFPWRYQAVYDSHCRIGPWGNQTRLEQLLIRTRGGKLCLQIQVGCYLLSVSVYNELTRPSMCLLSLSSHLHYVGPNLRSILLVQVWIIDVTLIYKLEYLLGRLARVRFVFRITLRGWFALHHGVRIKDNTQRNPVKISSTAEDIVDANSCSFYFVRDEPR